MELVPLEDAHVPAVTRAMTRAFWNDPQMLWLFPDEAERARLLPWLLRVSIRYTARAGLGWTTSDLNGVALWLPPGARPAGFFASARSGALSAPLRLGWARFSRFATLASRGDQLRRRMLPEPHWHLAGLGVDPAAQRQGIGAALLRPILERAARERAPCYLETYNPANLAFYVAQGFVVRAEESLLDGAPTLWGMVRREQGTSDREQVTGNREQ